MVQTIKTTYSENPALSICAIQHAASSSLLVLITWHVRTWIKISTSTVVAVATCGTSQSSIIELSKLIISMHGAALNTLASSHWKIDTHPIHRPYTNPTHPLRMNPQAAGTGTEIPNSQLRMELVQKMEEAFGVRANAIRVNYYRTNKACAKMNQYKDMRRS